MNYSYSLPFHELSSVEIIEIFTDHPLATEFYHNKIFSCDEHNSYITGRDSNNLEEFVDCTYSDVESFNSLLVRESQNLSFFYMNIRSIPTRLDELLCNIKFGSLNVMAFTESRLSNETENIYHISGYEQFVNNRNTRGGGVCMYIDSSLRPVSIPELNFLSPDIESLFVEFTYNSKKNICGTIYRPPKGNINLFIDKIKFFCQYISENFQNCKVTIGGDMNLDLFKLEGNSNILEYYTVLSSFGYDLVINRPTRVSNISCTLIDHIWSKNRSENFNLKSCIVQMAISDHFPCFFEIPDERPNPVSKVKIVYREFSQSRDEMFSNKLLQEDWANIIGISDIQELYREFQNKFISIFNECYPIKERYIKRIDIEKPYITENLKSLIKEKRRLEKLYFKYPISFKSRFNSIRNQVNRGILRAKCDYFKRKLSDSSGDSAATWGVVNELLGRSVHKNSTIEILEIDNVVIKDGMTIANKMNDHFLSVGRIASEKFAQLDFDGLNETLSDEHNCRFHLEPITPEIARIIVKSLKNTSAGHDGIPVRLIKKNVDSLAHILCHICNTSFATGVFPSELKIAKIVCIHKGGPRKYCTNYRPISILPVIAKIIEKVVSLQLENYFESNNLFTCRQFGFRKGLSPELAIHRIVDNLYRVMDEGKLALGIFLDIKKAFDTVNWKIIIHKLKYYGVEPGTIEWFRSFLTGRRQYVSNGKTESPIGNVSLGIPQGSSLGPLLFNIFINDLVRSSYLLEFIIFADDTNLFLSSSNVTQLFFTANQELQKVARWFTLNHLELNLEKTNYILFRRRQLREPTNQINLTIDGCNISKTNCTRFLGVLIDENLIWKNHISFLSCKLSKYVHILARVRGCLDEAGLKLIYHSLVYSNLLYCITLWGYTYKTSLKVIQVTQNKIVRSMTGLGRREPVENVLKQFGFLNITEIHKFNCCIYVFKSMQRNEGTFTHRFYNRNTRESSLALLEIPTVRTNHSQQNISFIGATFWNQLPREMRMLENLSEFKKHLKHFLLIM